MKMNEDWNNFLSNNLRENKNLTSVYLNDLILDSEKPITLHELSGPQYRQEHTDIRISDSKLYLLTNKRIIILIIDSDLVTIKYYDLRDIRSFKVLRENDITQRPNGVIPTKGIKNLKIYLKYQESDKDYFTLDLEPDINGPIPFYMQKSNAFNFICKLNELLLTDN